MFNKNKKKIDSRIRFQNSGFKRQLELARGYKRPKKNLPQTDWAVFFSRIGLGSTKSKIGTIFVFFFLIYIVFIPNIFFVKGISISGVDPASTVSIRNLVDSYLTKYNPWPQKNIIFLSKNNLKNYLLENNQKIFSVDQINKKMPSTLSISITLRIDNFLVQTASSTFYSISNDGVATSELYPNASGTLPSLPVLIKLTSEGNLIVGSKTYQQNIVNFINSLHNQLPKITKSEISFFEEEGTEAQDLTVHFTNGFKILFDLNSDPTKTLSRLSLLFSQINDTDIKKLYYVDMRYDGRGYVCQKATPCVQDINLPKTQNSTTTNFITN